MWPFAKTDSELQADELVSRIEEIVRTKPDQIVEYVVDPSGGKLLGFMSRYTQTNGNEIIMLVERTNLTVRLNESGKLFDYNIPLGWGHKRRLTAALSYFFREKMLRAVERKFS